MKLLVTGHTEHGKDTACEFLTEKFHLNFASSSYFVTEKAVRPYLADRGLIYPSLQECYADRVNHRAKWYDAIVEYNTPDQARLGRELFTRMDIYCGLRSFEEFRAQRRERLFDFSIWVDRSFHLPHESEKSMKIRREDCDFVLDNNRGLEDLKDNVVRLYDLLRVLKRAQQYFP